MKYTKSLAAVAFVAAMTAHTAQAADIRPAGTQIQIAENIERNIPAENRNVTAHRLTKPAVSRLPAEKGPRNAQPPGAQALMALGIALIVTPSMLRGAFSN